MESQSAVINDRDFATLDCSDRFAKYINQLCLVFERLLACYEPRGDGNTREAQSVRRFLSQLLNSIKILRIKYTHKSVDRRSLWIDLTESGFPNCMEFEMLLTDYNSRKRRMLELPAASLLKRSLLDYMFKYQRQSEELLAQLSERTYLEMLEENAFFRPFTSGEIVRNKENAEARSYLFSWGCFDFVRNRPYLHLMTFDQSDNAPELEKSEKARQDFLDLIRAEGSRVPDVGLLALAIDDGLDWIHPKIIKRICIGPLYSPLLLEGREHNEFDPREKAVKDILQRYSRNEHDFLLFFTDEIIFSKRQELSRTLFSPSGRIREVFSIPETDPECFERRASVIHRNVLLPHAVLQNLTPNDLQAVPDFEQTKKFTFDQQGAVHGV